MNLIRFISCLLMIATLAQCVNAASFQFVGHACGDTRYDLNSFASCTAAREFGAWYLEVDALISSDGIPFSANNWVLLGDLYDVDKTMTAAELLAVYPFMLTEELLTNFDLIILDIHHNNDSDERLIIDHLNQNYPARIRNDVRILVNDPDQFWHIRSIDPDIKIAFNIFGWNGFMPGWEDPIVDIIADADFFVVNPSDLIHPGVVSIIESNGNDNVIIPVVPFALHSDPTEILRLAGMGLLAPAVFTNHVNVPEPSGLQLICLAFGGLGLLRARQTPPQSANHLEGLMRILACSIILAAAQICTAVTMPDRGLAAIHGSSLTHPENTLAAFREAIRLGVHQIEFDVFRAADGLVVIHDPTVDRTTNGTGLVLDKTIAELQSLDAGSWKGSIFAGERIPTFVEALEIMPSNVWINVHIKPSPGDAFSLSFDVATIILSRDRQHQAVVTVMGSDALAGVDAVDPAILTNNMLSQSLLPSYVDATIDGGHDFLQFGSPLGQLPAASDIDRLELAGIHSNYFGASSLSGSLTTSKQATLINLLQNGIDFPLVHDVGTGMTALATIGIGPRVQVPEPHGIALVYAMLICTTFIRKCRWRKS